MLLREKKLNSKRCRATRHHHHHHPQTATTMAAVESYPERRKKLPPPPPSTNKLSLFVGFAAESFSTCSCSEGFSRSPTPKSPRSFDDGAVGLGIVAAMNDSGGGSDAFQISRTTRSAVPTRSEPIPIVSARPDAKIRVNVWRDEEVEEEEKEEDEEEDEDEEEEMELSESYTCVISHVGGDAVKKRVYFDDGGCVGPDGIAGNYWGCSGVFLESPPPAKSVLPPADFLSRCYLCRRKLHGLDIFMYRGDKAFCSVECRCQQIASDEHREKCGSHAQKPFDCSISPCSASFLFSAGVAAA